MRNGKYPELCNMNVYVWALSLDWPFFLGAGQDPAILTNGKSPPKNIVDPGKDELTSVTGTLFTKSYKLRETPLLLLLLS